MKTFLVILAVLSTVVLFIIYWGKYKIDSGWVATGALLLGYLIGKYTPKKTEN